MIDNIGRAYFFEMGVPFIVGLLIAIPVCGMFFHEMGHFAACLLLGLQIVSWSPTQVVHAASRNPAVNVAVAFSGGVGQALSSFMFVLAIALIAAGPLRTNRPLESRLRNWAAAVGLEAGFMTIGFTGIVMAFWEGLYGGSYDFFASNAFVWIIITFICAFLGFLVLYRVFPAPFDSENEKLGNSEDGFEERAEGKSE